MVTLLQNRGIGDLQTTIIIIVILLILWVGLRQMGHKRKRRSFRSTSLASLRKSYINGEISEEEYEKQKKDLTEKRK